MSVCTVYVDRTYKMQNNSIGTVGLRLMDGREQENTVVSLQRDEFVMIQAAFSKGCRTLPFPFCLVFLSWTFCGTDNPLCLFPTICVRAFWGLEYSWSVIPAVLFSPQHEGGALWQLNPTLATIPSICLPPFFPICTVPFSPFLCFNLCLHLDVCLLCTCERKDRNWEPLSK